SEQLRVNTRPHAPHKLDIERAKHIFQVSALLEPNAVLAGNRAPQLDAEPKDFSGQLLRPLQRPLFATVVHDQRMQISITGMKDVSDADAVLLAQAIDLTQRFPQT